MRHRKSGIGRIVALLFVGGLILFTVLAGSLPSQSNRRANSSLSVGGGGVRALFLLAREFGYDVGTWTGAPGHLEREPDLLFLLESPELPPGYESLESRESAEGSSRAGGRRTRDPLHYRRFVEEGGTLLVAGTEEMLSFLANDLGLNEFEELVFTEKVRSGRLKVRFLIDADEQLRLSAVGKQRFEPLSINTPFETIAVDPEDLPRVVRLDVGRGSIAVLTSSAVFTNQRIKRNDNALYFLRILEALQPYGRVLFDEYALGGWTPDSPLALALSEGRRTFSFHLLVAFVLLVWCLIWVGPFARDGSNQRRVAPRARAEGIASLYTRAKRWDLLGRSLQVGVFRRIAPRALVHGELAPEDKGEETGLFALPGIPQVEEALQPVVSSRLGDEEWSSARNAFSRTVTTAAELEELARELASWEKRLTSRSARHASKEI